MSNYKAEHSVFDREKVIRDIICHFMDTSDGFVSEILDLVFVQTQMLPEGIYSHISEALQQLSDEELKRIIKKYHI